MKDFINFIKGDKKIMIIGIVVVVVLLLLLILPNLSQSSSGGGTVGVIDNEMTLDKYLAIKSNSTLLFPKTNDEFRYNVYDNYIEITECLSTSETVTVPGTIEDLPVLVMRSNAFSKSPTKSISFEPGIVYIDELAFAENLTLETVVLPDTLLRLDSYAFAGCSNLESVNLGKNLEQMGDAVFNACENLSNIVFSEKLQSVGASVFAFCNSLSNVELPKSLTTIGANAFQGCQSLTSLSIPEGVVTIPELFCQNCPALTYVDIAGVESTDKNTVPRTISDNAFANCSSLTNISIPRDFTTISSTAFENSSESLMIYGYTSSAAAVYAAEFLINFAVLDEENFKTNSTIISDIRTDILNITNKYIDADRNISFDNAESCIKELMEYGQNTKTKNANVSGYGIMDDYFVIAFINGQNLSVKLNIDTKYYESNMEATANA